LVGLSVLVRDQLTNLSGTIFYYLIGTIHSLILNINIMFGKKSLGLALAGIAAYAWYKYSQLSEDEKRDITNNIKEKGKKILGSLKKGAEMNGKAAFDESTQYAG